MKSFRNLVLSLFLAAGVAGFTACSDGNMGPAGPQGPAGAPGAPGPKGDAGEAGKTADEIPRTYAFLKNWGKADGMVACNDDILSKMDAFPGPALTKSATPAVTDPTFTAFNTTTEGACSSDVFRTTTPFDFTTTHMKAAMVTETRTGTASVGPSNPTQTTVTKSYIGGTVEVKLNQNFAELAGRELLFTRCGKGKKPGTDSLMGDFRIEKTVELERVIQTLNGVRGPKPDSGTGADVKSYDVSKWETKVCVRFSPVGTVKCYVRTNAERRDSNGEKDFTRDRTGGGSVTAKRTVTEQIALYKNGLMQIAPMPVNNLLFGSGGGTRFPFGPATGDTDVANLNAAGKLCNLFDGGVIKCTPATDVPNSDGTGTCVAAP